MNNTLNHAITNNLGSSIGWGEKDFRYADRVSNINLADGTITLYYQGSRNGKVDKFIQENSIYLEKPTYKGWVYMGVVTKVTKLIQYRKTDPVVYELIIDTTRVINEIVPGTLVTKPRSKSKDTALELLGFVGGGPNRGQTITGAFGIHTIA